VSELPIRSDPEVLEHLYTRFTYLRGYPLRLQGSFIEDSTSLVALDEGDFLAFLMAYDEERASYPAAFSFLTKGENTSLNRYRLLRPAEPWPQPLVEVAWDDRKGQGVTLDVNHVDVVLREVDTAQLWYGDETGVIWEAFYTTGVRARPDHEHLLHQLWGACERLLVENGARFAYTYSREPSYEDAWYGAFLHTRGYRRDLARAHLPGGRVTVVEKLHP
jgi:hypothetical protein